MVAALGRWAIEKGCQFTDLARLIWRFGVDLFLVARSWNAPVLQVFFRQIYFTGLEALRVVAPVSIALGAVLVIQIMTLVGSGNESLVGKVLVWVTLREIAPLLTALIVIARSGTAIAAELGGMKIAGEIAVLEAMGIPPAQYLVLPRLLGAAVSVAVLTIYFELFSLLGGFLAGAIGWHLPLEPFYRAIFSALTVLDLAIALAKGFLFGLFLAAACCQQGLAVEQSATHIPQAATRGVMHSLFLIFVLDGVLALPLLF